MSARLRLRNLTSVFPFSVKSDFVGGFSFSKIEHCAQSFLFVLNLMLLEGLVFSKIEHCGWSYLGSVSCDKSTIAPSLPDVHKAHAYIHDSQAN